MYTFQKKSRRHYLIVAYVIIIPNRLDFEVEKKRQWVTNIIFKQKSVNKDSRFCCKLHFRDNKKLELPVLVFIACMPNYRTTCFFPISDPMVSLHVFISKEENKYIGQNYI